MATLIRRLLASLPVYIRGLTETNNFRGQDAFNKELKLVLETGRHDVQRLPMHAAAFQRVSPATAGGPRLTLPNWDSGTVAADTVTASIPLPEGERLRGAEFYVNRDTTGSIVARIWRQPKVNSGATQLGDTATTALVTGDDTLLIECSDVVVAGVTYYLDVSIDFTAVDGDLRLLGANVLYDRP